MIIQLTVFFSSFYQHFLVSVLIIANWGSTPHTSTPRQRFTAKQSLWIIHRIAILEFQLPVSAGNVLSIAKELKLETWWQPLRFSSEMFVNWETLFTTTEVTMNHPWLIRGLCRKINNGRDQWYALAREILVACSCLFAGSSLYSFPRWENWT